MWRRDPLYRYRAWLVEGTGRRGLPTATRLMADRAFTEEGHWNREARRVIGLAAELQVDLCREMLLSSDIRELTGLHQCLLQLLQTSADCHH